MSEGVSEGAKMDGIQSKSESARERERYLERERGTSGLTERKRER